MAPAGRKQGSEMPRADEMMPDDIRRRDHARASPEGFPRPDEEQTAAGRVGSPDGGVAEHPIHDEDLEDLDAADYEHEIDEVERATLQEHPEGSAPPLDRLTQDRKPTPDKD